MASAISIAASPLLLPSSSSVNRISASSSCKYTLRWKPLILSSSPSIVKSRNHKSYRLICRAVEYKFPDPIPKFAEAEIEKFETHFLKRLPRKKDIYGNSIEEIVGICTEIFNNFLHKKYVSLGTLLVLPFVDIFDTIIERGFPGAPQVARTIIKWAQKHVDNDWKTWNSNNSS